VRSNRRSGLENVTSELSSGQSGTAAEAGELDRDGRRDFDYLVGAWAIANRRLVDPLAEGSAEWLEFPSSSQAQSILGGLGNLERYVAPAFPGRGSFEGLSLRLFDPATSLWRIWWASTAQTGSLDTPVVGRFADGRGRFECQDVLNGRPLHVRYDWKDITGVSATWEQAFSFDSGETWQPNWIMKLTRES
jgi:hypothetical protein